MSIRFRLIALLLSAIVFLASHSYVFAAEPSVESALEPDKSRDLVFGLGDVAGNGSGESFYQNGTFMLGDKIVSVEPGVVAGTELATYDAKDGKIIVSNDKTVAEADKGAAVLQLMDALSIESIEPAAGQ